MFKAFYLSKKFALWAWGGSLLILLSLLVQTQINVAFNDWYKDFYDLLQKAPKNATIDEFYKSLKDFSLIAFPYVLVATLTAYFSRLFAFAWREALTFAYIDKWRECSGTIEGSSQRIQEDIYHFAKIVEGLGISIIRAFMTLIAFLPILYSVGKGLGLPLVNEGWGLIFWAVMTSVGGLIISWIVGMKLPKLEYNNQRAEAAFRKELVYAENDRINYASKESIIELFTGVKLNYKRLFLHYGYFDVWLYLYEQLMAIFAFLLIGGNLFTGALTLGVLMQISNAFGMVRSSFSVLTSNWTTITELRSIHKRLKEFEVHIGF